jgi:hypothetical protein
MGLTALHTIKFLGEHRAKRFPPTAVGEMRVWAHLLNMERQRNAMRAEAPAAAYDVH